MRECKFASEQVSKFASFAGSQLLFKASCQVASCQVVKFDPWDFLNNFCFHVYAQKTLFMGENGFLGPHHQHPVL